MKVTILGNGPSLAKVALPTSLTIGVNQSYKKYWSPWAASVDIEAIFDMIVEANPAKYIFPFSRTPITALLPNIDFEDSPSNIRPIFSGPYAYWYTLTHLKFFKTIYLLGFDLDSDLGHFYKTKKPLMDYSLHKVALKKILESSSRKVETKIWYKYRWMELEERLEK